MFTSRNSNLNAVISALENFKDNVNKYSESQSKVFLNLQDWSVDGNNVAIQDISSKLMNLFLKYNTDLNPERSIALKEITGLFKKFKENDTKLNKLHQELLNAEKLEKKRFEELAKYSVSTTKNIRDYEVRLSKAKLEKEKLQLKYYDLCKETETSKAILFKANFLRLNEFLLKQNRAENILLNAMNELVHQIPDIDNIDELKDMSYTNMTNTNEICNRATRNLNNLFDYNNCNLALELREHQQKQNSSARKSFSFIKHKKKSKSRISCPPNLTPNIYPNLKEPYLPPTYSDSERGKSITTSSGDLQRFELEPSAPPKSDESTDERSQMMPQLNYFRSASRIRSNI